MPSVFEWRVPVATCARERGGELGPVGEDAPAATGDSVSRIDAPFAVDDHDAAARIARVAPRERRTSCVVGVVSPRSSVSSASDAISERVRSISFVRSRRSLRPYWMPSGISSAASTTTRQRDR